MRLEIHEWTIFALLRRHRHVAGGTNLARADRVRIRFECLLLRFGRLLRFIRLNESRVLRDDWRGSGLSDKRQFNRFFLDRDSWRENAIPRGQRISYNEMQQ